VVGPGRCESYGTNQNGRLPAYERTELRGWVVQAPHWTESDEMGMNVLLDWGWEPLAEGVHALNTPDAIIGAITPASVIMRGVNPNDFRAVSSRLSGGRCRSLVVDVSLYASSHATS
jgi:hypothetical protein